VRSLDGGGYRKDSSQKRGVSIGMCGVNEKSTYVQILALRLSLSREEHPAACADAMTMRRWELAGRSECNHLGTQVVCCPVGMEEEHWGLA
jgi:hypothetical protein